MQHCLLTDAMLRGFRTAQELATAGGISLDTAKRYRRGDTYPNALTVARLMRHSREVVDAMLRLAGLDDVWLDHEQARLLRELIELQQRRAPHVAAALATAETAVDGARSAPASARRKTPRAAAAGQEG